jgi:hypothetical protein
MLLGTATLAAGALLLLVLGGCAVAPAPSAVERDFGLAHRLAIFNQTADLDAEENLAPVEGQAGGASLGAYRAYLGTFAAPAGGPVYAGPGGAGVTIQIQDKTTTDTARKPEK